MGRGDTHQKNRERRRNGNAEQHGYFPRYVALQIKRADGKWFHPGLTSPAACGFVQARGEFLLRVGALQVLVVGAGVVGLAVARAAAVAGHDVIAAEAADAIGTGISSRNSEVIHAGMYYPSGSLRARHCVRGNRLLHAYCQSRGIAHRKCGKLIVATSAAEQDKLEAIHRQGLANGVPGLRLIDGKTARAMEPELDCIAALHSPETGIIDGHSFMLALQGDLESHGGAIAFETPVERIARAGSGWRVAFDGRDAGTLEVDAVVNSAGLRAQTLARQIEGYPAERVPRLVLAKGNYFSYTGRPVFTRLIYPTPVDGGLGVHVTLDLAGRMRFGPDVEWIEREDYEVDARRADQFYARIRTYWPGLRDGTLVPDYCGVRPKLTGPGEPAVDFLVEGPSAHGLPGLVNLFGIESPGLTSALSLADDIVAGLVR
ncbi:MAG: L-2-hydroxyglutarate oxidase LhgO [Pseudorhodoplanes sp.]|nr:L-2-hydroxyglutarate oxidase LhgO [Pseudorhodoplanes sp.]